MLNRKNSVYGLPDGSEKPGEDLCDGFVPDLQRTAGAEVEKRLKVECPL